MTRVYAHVFTSAYVPSKYAHRYIYIFITTLIYRLSTLCPHLLQASPSSPSYTGRPYSEISPALASNSLFPSATPQKKEEKQRKKREENSSKVFLRRIEVAEIAGHKIPLFRGNSSSSGEKTSKMIECLTVCSVVSQYRDIYVYMDEKIPL